MDPAYEWELSKENVQPLKTGRKFCNLSAALQPSSTDGASKIKEEKKQFELELRTYTGDDPLSVWYGYIMWMEQNYPTGGRSQLSHLLEQCMAQYKDEEKYKNDPRFLQLWIKFAQLCTDPREIYSFMYNQGICSDLAAFYESWASELETIGNTKRADAIYQQGIDRMAQPSDWLIQRHRDFQMRIASRIANGETGMDVGPGQQDDAENRVSLAAVQAHGRSKKVSSIRTPLSKPTILNTSRNVKTGSNIQGPGFTIFQEDENVPSSLPPETKQWAKVPIRSEVNRENEQKPGRWTEAKVRQRPGFNAGAPAEPSFHIHQDKDVSQPQVTPCKVNSSTNSVLSARKQKPAHDPLQVLTTPAGETKQVPMYCKHLVYTGAEEFSIEEIRAAQIIKKQEMRKREQQEEERLKMEEQLRLQREELAAILQQKLKMEQEIQQCQQQQGADKMEVSEEPEKVQLADYPASSTESEDSCASDSMSTQRLLAYQLSSSSLPEVASTSMTEKSILSRQTPETNTYCKGTPQSGGISAPSPTVNTKDAMRLVMGLFNQSMHGYSQWDRNSNSALAPPAPAAPMSAAPFTIFVDDDSQTPATPKVDDLEDIENRPPSGYQNGPQRLALSGVLQPSTDIPFDPKADPALQVDDADMADDGEILAMPLQPYEAELMEYVDGGADLGDITFAPGFSSTRNYTTMAKQLTAVSRFSDTMEEPGEQRTTCTPNKTNISSNLTASQQVKSKSVNEGSSLRRAPMSQSGTMELTAERTRSDNTFPSLSNLSAITECSDEDTKASAMTKDGSQLAAHTLSKAALTGSTETSLHQQTNGTSCTQHHLSTLTETASLSEESSHVKQNDSRREPGLSSMNQTCHEIDVSNYIAADEDGAADLLSQSVMVNRENDPFDQELIDSFLDSLDRPIHTYPEYHSVNGPLPAFKARHTVQLGDEPYNVLQRLGEGAYAKVYQIERVKEGGPNSRSQVAKVQRPACPWEFYISSELHLRLNQLSHPMGSAFMKIEDGYIHKDGSCFVTDFAPLGSLLDVVNGVRVTGKTLPEPLSVLLAIQLLKTLEALMSVDIIHGDIKPDNFLFRGFPLIPEGSSEVPSEPCLELIDFGRSIDMKMFSPGTTFSVGVDTSGFQCVEMMTGRPWTYQTDMFGMVGTMNVIIFGSYMKVRRAGERWKTNFQFKRWFKTKAAMTEVFDKLLNVPSCSQLPDVPRLRRLLEDSFQKHLSASYNACAKGFMSAL